MNSFFIKKIVSRTSLARFFIIGLFFILVVVILLYGSKPPGRIFKEGDISSKDIYSPYNVDVPTEIDQEATNRLIDDRLKEQPVLFRRAEKMNKVISGNINSLFDNAKTLKSSEAPFQEKLEKLKQTLGVPIAESALRRLLESENIDDLNLMTNQILDELLSVPIIKDEDKKSLKTQNKTSLIVLDESKNTEQSFSLDGLLSQGDSRDFIKGLKAFSNLADTKIKQDIIEIIAANIQPTIYMDAQLTKERQDLVIKKIAPVYKQVEIKKDELIAERGRRFTKDNILILNQLFKSETYSVYLRKISGILIIVFIWTFIGLFSFKIFEKDFYLKNKLLLLVLSVTVLITLISKLINLYQLPVFICAAPLGAMLILLLINPQVAFISGFLISKLSALASGVDPSVVMIYLTGSLTSVIFMIKARQRAHVLRAGLLVGLFLTVAIIAASLFKGQIEGDIFLKVSYGLLSGFISASLTLVLLPIFEYIFGLTTDISLLELSDLNHPLLKMLAERASGTYHHSITVGSLAEAACDVIGAKSLLARVGSYYHDVGKLHMSRYFAENSPHDKDEHSRLTPTISKIIITNHIKEGVELARKYRLNDDIIRFIKEHHGTSVIHYFYQKALEDSKDVEELKEENFRYIGPKPQTKEAAIVLLADAVEAASRALSEPTPASLKELVHDLINNKFIDGQLDECDLTLKDLNKIAESFLRVLLGIFHARVEYPSSEKEDLKISIERKADKSA
jgi:putative nucleotidyltransferase with HDIG domain